MHRAARVALCSIALASSAAAARERDAFLDPLDVPAARSPLAARRLLSAVALAGPRVVAAGQRGHVLYSDDGGQSWSQAEVPVSTDLTGLSFPSAERGWAVGHDGVVLASADGGRSWQRQLDGRRVSALLAAAAAADGIAAEAREQLSFLVKQGADLPLLDVWFDDERSGTVVGAFGLILRTRDGGATWTPWLDRTENPKALHLHAVRRAAGALWIAGEQGLVLKLDPGAERFRRCPTPYDGSFFGLTGTDRAVLVFGLRGHVLRSADGGASWQAVGTGLEAAITGGARAGEAAVTLVSAAGQVLVSRDDGQSFAAVATARPLPISAVAVGGRGVALVGPFGARVDPIP